MVNKNALKESVFVGISSLLLFLIILFSSLNHTISDKGFYEDEFQKLGVYDRFGKYTADAQRDNLQDYFDNKDSIISSDFFNEKEKQHLIDVKNLMISSKIILAVSLLVLTSISAWLYIQKKDLLRSIAKTSIGVGIIALAFFLASFLLQNQFSELFTRFHVIFFDNDLWLLNPATDDLINLFPEEFFQDAAINIIKDSIALSALFLFEGITFLSVLKHHRR